MTHIVTLPLWDPMPVSLGAVGYLSKPTGTFVTLFDSFHPERSTSPEVRGLPSLYGYGRVAWDSQRQDKRSMAQRGLDAFVGLLTFKGRGDGPVSYVFFFFFFPFLLFDVAMADVWDGVCVDNA